MFWDPRYYIKCDLFVIDPLRFGGFSPVNSARTAPLTSSLIELSRLEAVGMKYQGVCETFAMFV